MRPNALRDPLFHRLAVLVLAFAGAACQGTNFYTVEDDVVMGAQAFDEIQAAENVIRSGPDVDQVERVTARLVESALEIDPEEIADKLEDVEDKIDEQEAVDEVFEEVYQKQLAASGKVSDALPSV